MPGIRERPQIPTDDSEAFDASVTIGVSKALSGSNSEIVANSFLQPFENATARTPSHAEAATS